MPEPHTHKPIVDPNITDREYLQMKRQTSQDRQAHMAMLKRWFPAEIYTQPAGPQR